MSKPTTEELDILQFGKVLHDHPRCVLCGEPMPEGEEMFKYHGYSGNCPKPPPPKPKVEAVIEYLHSESESTQVLLTTEQIERWERESAELARKIADDQARLDDIRRKLKAAELFKPKKVAASLSDFFKPDMVPPDPSQGEIRSRRAGDRGRFRRRQSLRRRQSHWRD
jgi:hypothetical protein